MLVAQSVRGSDSMRGGGGSRLIDATFLSNSTRSELCDRRFEAHKGHRFLFCFAQRILHDFIIRNLDGRIAEIRCQIRGLISNMQINFWDIPEHSLENVKKR